MFMPLIFPARHLSFQNRYIKDLLLGTLRSISDDTMVCLRISCVFHHILNDDGHDGGDVHDDGRDAHGDHDDGRDVHDDDDRGGGHGDDHDVRGDRDDGHDDHGDHGDHDDDALRLILLEGNFQMHIEQQRPEKRQIR
ncbi:hypothetical protein CEXT_344631 [Caerostris extrusa]|uniref:Uncharacterized protein n=1 Tax=Caerostris extrusa TaxID=172846 RepID=A0AAV4P0B6_CAEEX|nr:hypothetical protein CEXT_344631 [Caerostris extrusa]